jgi:hypothetical protein
VGGGGHKTAVGILSEAVGTSTLRVEGIFFLMVLATSGETTVVLARVTVSGGVVGGEGHKTAVGMLSVAVDTSTLRVEGTNLLMVFATSFNVVVVLPGSPS